MTTCISCQPGWGNAQNLSSQCRNHLCLFLYYKGFDWTENQTIVVLSDIRLPQFINDNNKLLILILLIIIIVIVIIIVIIVSLFTSVLTRILPWGVPGPPLLRNRGPVRTLGGLSPHSKLPVT